MTLPHVTKNHEVGNKDGMNGNKDGMNLDFKIYGLKSTFREYI